MKRKERILIVDDEPDIAFILKLQLEDAGFHTQRARDGLEALKLLDQESFSLMLLDIKMPLMNGLQVLEKVQAEHQDVPVIMMTAHGSENIAVEAMKQGAADYIAKPFHTEDLLKNVERVLELAEAKRENLRLQRAVEEERRKMEAIIQAMADLLIAVDENGAIISMNRTAERVLGVKRDEALGVQVQEVLKGDIPPERLPCKVVLGTMAECLDVSYTITSSGTGIPVLSSASPLIDSEGRLAGAVEIIRDISALRALEQEREDFVSMLSHDLKSPITAVVGSIDLVREGRLGPVNKDQAEYLESGIESCDDIVEMIDNLLDVHKFEAGKMVMVFKEEDPHLLVQRIISKFRSVARKTGVTLYATTNGPLMPVLVDRTKFARLLRNLISNSLKFTNEEGEIEVKLQIVAISDMREVIPSVLYPDGIPAEGNYLCMSVRDSGSGIPEDSLTTIFDRYEQAKSRRSGKSAGTGLGLTFCRRVMDAHGGFIWGESKPSKGSIFSCLFPLKSMA